MMSMLRSIALLLVLSGSLLACSEEAASPRKSLGGVEGQTALKELDDDQLEAVCGAAKDKLESNSDDDDLARGACVLIAHVSSGNAADEVDACEQALDGCLSTDIGSPSPCDDDVASSCTLTVNDFDLCLTSAEALYRELSDQDCDDVSEESEDLDRRIQASANACDAVARCFAEDASDAGQPDASDPILDASQLDSSDPALDASEQDASDDDDAGE